MKILGSGTFIDTNVFLHCEFFDQLDWRTLVKSQLQTLGRKQLATKRLDTKTQDLRVLREAIAKHPESTQEQQAYWCARTGKNRASFYRTLSRHNDN